MDPEADTKKCPYCAETIKAEAVVCRYCGRDLIQPEQQRAISQPSPASPETTYYQSGDITITSARAVIGGQTYSMSNITSVSMLAVQPNRTGGIIKTSLSETPDILSGGGERLTRPLSKIGCPGWLQASRVVTVNWCFGPQYTFGCGTHVSRRSQSSKSC